MKPDPNAELAQKQMMYQELLRKQQEASTKIALPSAQEESEIVDQESAIKQIQNKQRSISEVGGVM